MINKILNRVISRLNWLQGIGWGSGTTSREVSHCLARNPNPQVVVDVGGNKGEWTAALLRKCSPAASYIVEPSTSNCKHISQRFAARDEVHVVPFALSHEDGQASLFSNEDGSGIASLHQRKLDHLGIPHEEVETIQMMSVDTFLGSHQIEKIDILKLDIEGHELAVLKAFPEDFLARVSVIQFEFGGCNIDSRTYFQDFWYLLSDQFSFYRMSPFGLIAVPAYRELEECFTTTNYLCVNRQT